MATSSEDDIVLAFQEEFKKRGYITRSRKLCSVGAALPHIAARTTKAVPACLLKGPPGVGKTYFAETFADYWKNAAFIAFQFTPGVSREDLMYDFNIANIAAGYTGKWEGAFKPEDALLPGILPNALEMSRTRRVVLLLDELDKANDKIDAFLLDFLNSCRITHPTLGIVQGNPKNLIVFITMNNQRLITEPLMRRCKRVTLGWPDAATEAALVKYLALKELKGAQIRGDVAGLAKTIVGLANQVRVHGNILKKVPSTPELGSAVRDCLILPKADRGETVYDWLVAYEGDQVALKDQGFPDARRIQGMLQQF